MQSLYPKGKAHELSLCTPFREIGYGESETSSILQVRWREAAHWNKEHP